MDTPDSFSFGATFYNVIPIQNTDANAEDWIWLYSILQTLCQYFQEILMNA